MTLNKLQEKTKNSKFFVDRVGVVATTTPMPSAKPTTRKKLRKRVFGFQIDAELDALVAEAESRTGLSRSALIRLAVLRGLPIVTSKLEEVES